MNNRIPCGPLEGHTLTVLRGRYHPHVGRRPSFYGYLDGTRVVKDFNPDYRKFSSRASLVKAAVKMVEGDGIH